MKNVHFRIISAMKFWSLQEAISDLLFQLVLKNRHSKELKQEMQLLTINIIILFMMHSDIWNQAKKAEQSKEEDQALS